MKNARFVIDWDDTLVEDRWPDQGPWLPGAVHALHELSRHGDIVIFSCRVSPYEFPTRRVAAEDVARDPAVVKQTVDRMRDMLIEVGLGHVEIWQRPYKPNATVYIDNRGVRFTGDWADTLSDVYEALKVEDEGRVIPELKGLFDRPSVFAPDRHPNSQAFHDRLDAWGDLHDQKQQDYGSDADPFANIRQGAADVGLPGWIGCAIRMRDKMQRILTAARQHIETGEVSMANEALIDSFDDLGVYSGIGAVLLEEES